MALPFQPVDWALCGATAVFAALGLFRGFSGAFAFLVASVAAAAFGVWLWPHTAGVSANVWARGAAEAFAAIVAFGVVRIAVKKLVNGLLAQPVDAIAGMITGLVCGALLVLAASRIPDVRERSFLAGKAAEYVV